MRVLSCRYATWLEQVVSSPRFVACLFAYMGYFVPAASCFNSQSLLTSTVKSVILRSTAKPSTATSSASSCPAIEPSTLLSAPTPSADASNVIPLSTACSLVVLPMVTSISLGTSITGVAGGGTAAGKAPIDIRGTLRSRITRGSRSRLGAASFLVCRLRGHRPQRRLYHSRWRR